jgi:prepilin-type N-terminal cleavage/methylation domain-containing protein
MKITISHSPAPVRRGFTLIELLVVISVIAVLAGLTLGVVKGVLRTKTISNAQAEMAGIESAIDRYHADYGIYPPSNTNNFLVNPLYFELVGTTNVLTGGTTNLTTLDGQNAVNVNYVQTCLGVDGFINCTRGSGEDMVTAKTLLPNLRANQINTATNTVHPVGSSNPGVAILVASVGGPDAAYMPLGVSGVNPWRYNSINPTNNPGTYDLYVQLDINGRTNLVCNWSKQVQINNSSFP